MSLSDNSAWLSSSRLDVSRKPPSSTATTSPSPAAEVAGHTSAFDGDTGRQRTIVVAGLMGIAAFVGYTLYKSSRESSPQVLFPQNADFGGAPKHIAFVNIPALLRDRVSKALEVWIPSHSGAVRHSFTTVTFVDESGDETVSSVRNASRYAALTAFAELRSHDRDVACAVVYRSAVAIDGEPVELTESNLKTVQRADKRVFHERHCLAYTVDGKGACLLTRDVVGVVDASLVSEMLSDGTVIERKSVGEVLRACCVATTGTLHQHTLSERRSGLLNLEGTTMGEAAATSSSGTRLHVLAEKARLPSTTSNSPVSSNAERLWCSPFFLFCDFSAVLCMARERFKGVQELLVKQPEASAFPDVRALQDAWRKACNHVLNSTENEKKESGQALADGANRGGLTCLPLSAHFYTAISVSQTVDGTATELLSRAVSSLVDDVLGKRAQVQNGAGGGSSSMTPLLVAVPHHKQTCIIIDLAAVEGMCSLLQAHRITVLAASLVSAVAGQISSCTLYAESPSPQLSQHPTHADPRREILRLPMTDAFPVDSLQTNIYSELALATCNPAYTSAETVAESTKLRCLAQYCA